MPHNKTMRGKRKDLITVSVIGTSVLFGLCCLMTYVPDQKVEPLNAAVLVGVILLVLYLNSLLNRLANKVVSYTCRWCLYAAMFFAFGILAGLSYRWEIVLLMATYFIGADWYRNDYRFIHGERHRGGTIRIKR